MKAPCLLIFVLALVSVRGATPNFEQHIAPILRSYCVGCHNADEPENGLSVETYGALRKGGDDKGDPIKAGDAENSFAIKSIERRARPHMPPKDEPPVPASELEMLKQWIAAGAPGPKEDVSILQNLVVPKIASEAKARPLTAAAWSPDGKVFAVASSGRIELRSSPTAKPRRVIETTGGKISSLHFTPDSRQLIVAGGITGLSGSAQIYDAKTGELVREFSGHRDALYDAELSPDGKILATAGYDRIIRLWNTADAKLLRAISVHNGAIFDLAFDPTGAVLASASADQTVKLWRVADGVRLDTLNQPQGELNAVAFTSDGKHILAAGNDKRVHIWNFVSREGPALNPVLHSRFAHEAPITALAIRGQNLITAAADRTLKLWSLPDLIELHAFPIQSDEVHAIAAHPRRPEIFVARMDGSLDRVALRRQETSAVAGRALETGRSPNRADALQAQNSVTESEPNNSPALPQVIHLPVEVAGAIDSASDADYYQFHAMAGQQLTFAVNAAQAGSPLDSKLQVLHKNGAPVEQVVLQATRDSWFTFRGKDSDTSGDFRLHNWAEMELNEFLYANGEVVQLWLYPRGPDSGFNVYPGEGKRHTLFNTTALTHALNEPAYIVAAHPAGANPAPNGLPVFRLHWENDDDPYRRAGADSLLLFTAPATADYLLKVTDTRGFGGTNFTYRLNARERRPDFSIAIEGANPSISPGSGREIRFVATRKEGFEGLINIHVANLPAGFSISGPIQIEAHQHTAIAGIYASADAKAPSTNHAVQIIAAAEINGRPVIHELTGLGQIKLGAKPKLSVEILPGPETPLASDSGAGKQDSPLHFVIRPGQTISARVRATRHDFKDRIELGNEDAGRNLPHGVYIDNIGLNGLLIVEGQTEREFFITASKIAAPGTRPFHLRAKGDGGQTSQPALLTVLRPEAPRLTSRQ